MTKKTFLVAAIAAAIVVYIGFPAALKLAEDDPDQAATKACRRELDSRKATYAQLLDAHQFWEAKAALGRCPDLLGDAVLAAMKAGALRLHHLTIADDKNASPTARISAITYLRNNSPADAGRFAAEFDRLSAALQKQAQQQAQVQQLEDARKLQRAQASDRERRRREGVLIGMTQQEVLASSWGKPRRVNRDTYRFGVHEQWVYDGGYLYFKDGILDAISN